jgi:hypothetical protein
VTARSVVSRFASKPIEVERSKGLRADHPALSEGRTIFPSMVVGSDQAPRFLVSGHNNPKLGKQVLKGERKGWPIFHLSLEERATCPQSCPIWSGCYGNSMPYARRHRPDALFIPYLWAELLTLARANRGGLLIRLHALGDFYSLEYVDFWRKALAEHPNLHVFGYTAHAPGSEIGEAIRDLTAQWDRFAIRFSTAAPIAQGSTVFDADPAQPNVIMCPAQVEKTMACASCGLCWAAAAREKTIGFLRHGMKSNVGPRGPRKAREVVAEPRPAATATDRLAALPDAERARIEAAYSVTFRRKAA